MSRYQRFYRIGSSTRAPRDRPVRPDEELRFSALLRAYRYLGFRRYRGRCPRLFLIVYDSLTIAAGTPNLAS